MKIIRNLIKRINRREDASDALMPVETAFDYWSETYDQEKDNLLILLDNSVFEKLVEQIDFENKVIGDIGCGTGRYWPYLLHKKPAALIGFDISKGMLEKLEIKYPGADIRHYTDGESLPGVEDKSLDFIVSTLTIGYMAEAGKAIQEWTRVLRPGGLMILTDYHPDAIAKGASRSFKNGDRYSKIESYFHSLNDIYDFADKNNLIPEKSEERRIDEAVRPHYERKNALHIYNKLYNVPILYGMLLRKPG